MGLQTGTMLNGIRRLPFGAGAPELAVASPNPVAMAVASTFIVFTDDGNGSPAGVFTAPIGGGKASMIASTAPPSGRWIATDGQQVVFSDAEGTKVVPVSGGQVRNITSARGDVAVVGATVVIADVDSGSLIEAPLVGAGSATTLLADQDKPGSPIACGTDLCWVDTVPSDCALPSAGANAQAMRTGPSGQVSPVLSLCEVTTDEIPSSLISYGSDVFLVAGGNVASAPIDGGAIAPIMGGSLVYWAAADSCCVYMSGRAGVEAAPYAPSQ